MKNAYGKNYWWETKGYGHVHVVYWSAVNVNVHAHTTMFDVMLRKCLLARKVEHACYHVHNVLALVFPLPTASHGFINLRSLEPQAHIIDKAILKTMH